MSGDGKPDDWFATLAAAAAADPASREIPVGDRVECDFCGGIWTDRTESGGLLFGTKAVCPDCAAETEKSARRNGEQGFIRARCPNTMAFADWVRGLRGPGAVIRVGPMPSFRCPRCGRVSVNPHDAFEGYCGACHDVTAPRKPGGQM